MILLSGGDPAGVAPELMEKSFVHLFRKYKGHLFCYFSTAGTIHKKTIQSLCQKENVFFSQDIYSEKTNSLPKQKKGLVFYDVPSLAPFPKQNVTLGEPSIYTGAIAFYALDMACSFAKNYVCSGLFTAPLAKEWVIRSGQKKFRGHTDYLAEKFNCQVLMLMHGKTLSVVPLTVHVPLKDVPKKLRKTLNNSNLLGLLQKIQQIPEYINTRWALCSLNPHVGEGGLLGTEEKFLRKFCNQLLEKEIAIDGPLSADALFMPSIRNSYRLVLSCYHDQGLIPFKALEGHHGVNCTIGLPFLRTSPDHGSGFDISGKGRASAESIVRALDLVIQGFA